MVMDSSRAPAPRAHRSELTRPTSLLINNHLLLRTGSPPTPRWMVFKVGPGKSPLRAPADGGCQVSEAAERVVLIN